MHRHIHTRIQGMGRGIYLNKMYTHIHKHIHTYIHAYRMMAEIERIKEAERKRREQVCACVFVCVCVKQVCAYVCIYIISKRGV